MEEGGSVGREEEKRSKAAGNRGLLDVKLQALQLVLVSGGRVSDRGRVDQVDLG